MSLPYLAKLPQAMLKKSFILLCFLLISCSIHSLAANDNASPPSAKKTMAVGAVSSCSCPNQPGSGSNNNPPAQFPWPGFPIAPPPGFPVPWQGFPFTPPPGLQFPPFQFPPQNAGGKVPPPQDGGTVPPPQGGGKVPPPAGDGKVPPPQGGGKVPPPVGDGKVPPPQGGGKVPPPQDGGNNNNGKPPPGQQPGNPNQQPYQLPYGQPYPYPYTYVYPYPYQMPPYNGRNNGGVDICWKPYLDDPDNCVGQLYTSYGSNSYSYSWSCCNVINSQTPECHSKTIGAFGSQLFATSTAQYCSSKLAQPKPGPPHHN
ncbi:hypothetical protein RJ639_037785 [Escallonia herrerae]|uniref:Prolamin-like domain-containing protein n=1 Tax=Escallonia herrerae TaxID=1293975 RepID=A0AA88WJL7_9ASTE|nr:hypothetical protein RJ639_037785 [Escallonia herrerae]